jgi:hypothetical protein
MCPESGAGEKLGKKSRLDIGGGPAREGWTTIDINPESDIVHDLNKYPWPVKDNSCDSMLMSHILEHLDNPLKAMHEAYRIARNGAIMEIRVPWWKTDMFSDPVHIRWFKPMWFRKLYNRKSNAAAIDSKYGKCDINWKVIGERKVRGKYNKLRIYQFHVWLKALK